MDELLGDLAAWRGKTTTMTLGEQGLLKRVSPSRELDPSGNASTKALQRTRERRPSTSGVTSPLALERLSLEKPASGLEEKDRRSSNGLASSDQMRSAIRRRTVCIEYENGDKLFSKGEKGFEVRAAPAPLALA